MILPKERLVCDGERDYMGWLEIPFLGENPVFRRGKFRGMTELFEKLDVDKSGSLKSNPAMIFGRVRVG